MPPSPVSAVEIKEHQRRNEMLGLPLYDATTAKPAPVARPRLVANIVAAVIATQPPPPAFVSPNAQYEREYLAKMTAEELAARNAKQAQYQREASAKKASKKARKRDAPKVTAKGVEK